MDKVYEPTFQWSIKLDSGEIYVVKADTREELEEEIIYIKGLITNMRTDVPVEAETPLETHPEVKEKASESIDDLSLCEIHHATMYEIKGKYGVFYSHGRKKDDGNWENCNGKGYK